MGSMLHIATTTYIHTSVSVLLMLSCISVLGVKQLVTGLL